MIKKLIFLSFLLSCISSPDVQGQNNAKEVSKKLGKMEDKIKSNFFQNWPSTNEGIKYKIHFTKESERRVIEGDILSVNILAMMVKTDSVLFNTYEDKKAFEIAANEITLRSIFALLKKGDSASFVLTADSLYLNSFEQTLPNGINPGDKIIFHINLEEIYNEEEFIRLSKIKNLELRLNDSLGLNNIIAADPKWKKTNNGLYYQIEKTGNGKKAVTGDQVTITYVGKFLNGEVFEKTDEKNPKFTFTKNNNMLIQGFEEGIGLMEEGGIAKFIIPWQLAYGEFGSGPIKPYTSLFFEIKLIKIKSK